ncbi:IS3 family transposase [Flavobacterium notoginsengisoli]|uniref:IS3 family transposase n=1 Tax=Flavobacterium notoginsengisoli TaxID=1478199 RepID=UPI0036374341
MLRKQRIIYSPLFKEQAVNLSYKRATLKELAIELEINPARLTQWRQIYQQFGKGSFPGTGKKRINPDKKEIFELEQKLKESEQKFDILINGSKYLSMGKSFVFSFISENEKIYPINKMCQILGVSESTFRVWKKQVISESQKRILLLRTKIISIYYEFNKQYGSVKITRELNNRGTKISIAQVAFHMKEMGLYRKLKRRFKVTTDSKHNLFTSPNVLNRNFSVNAPSKVWVSDITYIQIDKRFMYLTIIMDLYDRKIIGWNLGTSLSVKSTVLPAWETAISNREIKDFLIFHSDRGVQYASRAFVHKLDSYQCVTRSMNRKGNHLDNAVAESFFNTLKRELIHRQTKFLSKEEMREKIFDFIENWYNKKRIHSALNFKNIEEFNQDN